MITDQYKKVHHQHCIQISSVALLAQLSRASYCAMLALTSSHQGLGFVDNKIENWFVSIVDVPIWTRSRCENCLAKSSNDIQNSPSFLTRTLSNSLSLSDKLSHSQLLSLQGPFHSPRPQGFLKLQNNQHPKIFTSSIPESDQMSVTQLSSNSG